MSDSFQEELTQLATSIAQDAAKANTPLQERIDAFKALTSYYSALLKGKKSAPDEDDGDTFEDFSAQIASAGDVNGTAPAPQVRSRRQPS